MTADHELSTYGSKKGLRPRRRLGFLQIMKHGIDVELNSQNFVLYIF